LVGISHKFIFPIILEPATLSLQSDIFFEGRNESAQIHFKNISSDFHAGLQLHLSNYFSIFGGIERSNETIGLEISYNNFK